MEKKVLIVDDEPDLIEIIQYDLEEAAYSTLTASSAQQALDVLKKNPDVSAVVCDIVMPKMNGVQLLQEVRKHSSYPIFIFVTAYSAFDERTIFDLGGNAMVKKPFTRLALINNCERLLTPEKLRWDFLTNSKLKVGIEFEANLGDLGEVHFGRAGMTFKNTQNFRIADTFHFKFKDQNFEGVATVRWREGANCGVEFLTLTPTSFEYWNSKVDLKNLIAVIPKG